MKELEIKVIERLFNVNKKNIHEVVAGGNNNYGIDPLVLIAIISLLAQLMPYVIDWLSADRWFAKMRLRSIIKREIEGNYKTGPFSYKDLSDAIYETYQENKELKSEYNVAS